MSRTLPCFPTFLLLQFNTHNNKTTHKSTTYQPKTTGVAVKSQTKTNPQTTETPWTHKTITILTHNLKSTNQTTHNHKSTKINHKSDTNQQKIKPKSTQNQWSHREIPNKNQPICISATQTHLHSWNPKQKPRSYRSVWVSNGMGFHQQTHNQRHGFVAIEIRYALPLIGEIDTVCGPNHKARSRERERERGAPEKLNI